MTIRMPRGAIPTPRHELAGSEPFREPGVDVFVPSGAFPTPNHELAAGQPFRPRTAAPDKVLLWPIEIGSWGNDTTDGSPWAEEAFAKACAEPKVFLPADLVRRTAQECGSSNFAQFMQTRGFHFDSRIWLDGPFHSLDWTKPASLNAALAEAGPVKIGIAAGALTDASVCGRVTPGTSGWAIYGLPPGLPEDHCASLCGYGSLADLVGLFKQRSVSVDIPPGMPQDLCYALFARGSIGIVDRKSLMSITSEAWIRNPTTIVK